MNYLRLALEESFFSVGISRPNPAVGAVVVKDGVVVGVGRTQCPGKAHAEVMALAAAGNKACGGAMYVTLEPCCHYGRTPPCTKAIIEAGIKQVYFAHKDPNPQVRGKSRRELESVGIKVFEGLEACKKADVNSEEGTSVYHEIERFFEGYDYFVQNKSTFVEIKSAITQEGFMGAIAKDGCYLPVAITGEGANCWNHELRAMSDGILVGRGTLIADNPSLNVRYAHGNNPVKIIWAGHHEFSSKETALNVFKDETALVFSSVLQPNVKQKTVLLEYSTFLENWKSMIAYLSKLGMHRLLVEPGAHLVKDLFSFEGLWNRFDLWQSTDLEIDNKLGNQIDSGVLKAGLEFPLMPKNKLAKESFMVGKDILTVYV